LNEKLKKIINCEITEIPESTKEILKIIASLMSKPKSSNKVKTWSLEFESLINDINNHK